MKQTNGNTRFDQNWSWPQKTWFQERLNAVKARENETHRRLWDRPKNPVEVEAVAGGDKGPGED